MGYTTTFYGKFDVVCEDEASKKKLPSLFENFNEFCGYRHKYNKYPNIDSAWCDWEMVNDNDIYYIAWTGAEKSYNMYEWIQLLNDKFLKPNNIRVVGIVEARGEDDFDMWRIVADKNGIRREEGKVTYSQ